MNRENDKDDCPNEGVDNQYHREKESEVEERCLRRHWGENKGAQLENSNA